MPPKFNAVVAVVGMSVYCLSADFLTFLDMLQTLHEAPDQVLQAL